MYSSEGLAGAKVELARAESRALETISEAIQADGCSQTEYMIGQRYMDMFRTMVTQASKKVRSFQLDGPGEHNSLCALR